MFSEDEYPSYNGECLEALSYLGRFDYNIIQCREIEKWQGPGSKPPIRPLRASQLNPLSSACRSPTFTIDVCPKGAWIFNSVKPPFCSSAPNVMSSPIISRGITTNIGTNSNSNRTHMADSAPTWISHTELDRAELAARVLFSAMVWMIQCEPFRLLEYKYQ
ncbi:unnamed protein product, partial [Protopolystoma xenopodis]